MVDELYVFVWLSEKATFVGQIERIGPSWPPSGRSSRFRYALSWLDQPDAFPIDPLHLPLIRGWQLTPEGLQVPGAIRDATPDGWGKLSMELEYPDCNFGTLEYAAATRDDRSGFLDFGPEPSGPAPMNPDGQIKRVETAELSLEMLFEAAQRVDEGIPLPERLRPYFTRGSSIGGARPKATFVDNDGSMWVAKFPMRSDTFAVISVEAACLDMAAKIGVNTPEHRVERVGNSPVLLVRRFDRVLEHGTQHRLGYLSAETVFGADPTTYATNRGYSDLASAALRFGSNSGAEIFRRMLLNVLIGNTDDHLRNHAYIRGLDGCWDISPVYDIVPQLGRRHMVLAVGNSHELNFDTAVGSYMKFGLLKPEAEVIAGKATSVVGAWRDALQARGVTAADIDRVTPAFREADRYDPGPKKKARHGLLPVLKTLR